MKKNKLIVHSITLILLIVGTISILSYLSSANADSDKDFCYDQVGDGHFCFDTKEKCKYEQKHDEIAESHCYNRDQDQ